MTVIVLKTIPSVWEFVSAFLILPAEKSTLLTVEWTLQREMIFYALFAVMILWRRIGMVALGAWFLLSLIVPYTGMKGLATVFFDTHHLLFGMGMGICLLYRRGLIRSPVILTLAGASLFFVMWGILAYDYELRLSPTCRLLAGAGAALAITGLVGWESQRGLSVPRPLILLGEASFAIYLIHFPVVSALGRVVTKLGHHVPAQVLVLAVAVISLCVGLAYHLWIERPLMRFVNGVGVAKPVTAAKIVTPAAPEKLG